MVHLLLSTLRAPIKPLQHGWRRSTSLLKPSGSAYSQQWCYRAWTGGIQRCWSCACCWVSDIQWDPMNRRACTWGSCVSETVLMVPKSIIMYRLQLLDGICSRLCKCGVPFIKFLVYVLGASERFKMPRPALSVARNRASAFDIFSKGSELSMRRSPLQVYVPWVLGKVEIIGSFDWFGVFSTARGSQLCCSRYCKIWQACGCWPASKWTSPTCGKSFALLYLLSWASARQSLKNAGAWCTAMSFKCN